MGDVNNYSTISIRFLQFLTSLPEMSGVTFFDSDSYSYSELSDSDSEKFENANSDSEISLMIKILNTRDEVRSG